MDRFDLQPFEFSDDFSRIEKHSSMAGADVTYLPLRLERSNGANGHSDLFTQGFDRNESVHIPLLLRSVHVTQYNVAFRRMIVS